MQTISSDQSLPQALLHKSSFWGTEPPLPLPHISKDLQDNSQRQLSDGPVTAQGSKPEGQVIGFFFSSHHGLKRKTHEPRRMLASVPSEGNFHKIETVI